jgi:hypothetical protein
MAFRRGGAKKRRDRIEPDVVAHLRAFGATVIQLSGCAPVPDLLVGFRGRWHALEVKSGHKAGFTEAQRDAMVNATMAPTVVRSVDEAILAIGAGGRRSEAR